MKEKINKVIEGLKHCLTSNSCVGCPYRSDLDWGEACIVKQEALEVLEYIKLHHYTPEVKVDDEPGLYLFNVDIGKYEKVMGTVYTTENKGEPKPPEPQSFKDQYIDIQNLKVENEQLAVENEALKSRLVYENKLNDEYLRIINILHGGPNV